MTMIACLRQTCRHFHTFSTSSKLSVVSIVSVVYGSMSKSLRVWGLEKKSTWKLSSKRTLVVARVVEISWRQHTRRFKKPESNPSSKYDPGIQKVQESTRKYDSYLFWIHWIHIFFVRYAFLQVTFRRGQDQVSLAILIVDHKEQVASLASCKCGNTELWRSKLWKYGRITICQRRCTDVDFHIDVHWCKNEWTTSRTRAALAALCSAERQECWQNTYWFQARIVSLKGPGLSQSSEEALVQRCQAHSNS